MAILGVLLGLVIAGLIVLAYIGNERSKELASLLDKAMGELVTHRTGITALEKKHRAPATEPKPSLVGQSNANPPTKGTRMRTWNENIGAAESK